MKTVIFYKKKWAKQRVWELIWWKQRLNCNEFGSFLSNYSGKRELCRVLLGICINTCVQGMNSEFQVLVMANRLWAASAIIFEWVGSWKLWTIEFDVLLHGSTGLQYEAMKMTLFALFTKSRLGGVFFGFVTGDISGEWHDSFVVCGRAVSSFISHCLLGQVVIS